LKNKTNSRWKDRAIKQSTLPKRSSDAIPSFIVERAFGVHAADCGPGRPFTLSQAVSIARALKPYAEDEARSRRAHGSTAPGRGVRSKRKVSFKSRDFIARCVGFAPATLRKAAAVVAAAERDPGLLDP